MFWFSLIKRDNKLSQITQDDIKWNGNKAFCCKKIRRKLDQIRLGELRRKTHYMDSAGTVGAIRQRLKDIELQYWMSKRSNARSPIPATE